MAERFDVDGALEEGMPAVETISEYVLACRRIGGVDAALDGLSAAYTAERGMDLRALDADQMALSVTAAALDEALRAQHDAASAASAAWQGVGADGAGEILHRHTAAAELATAAVRGAAETLAELRDRLWPLVQEKVTAVVAIESRAQSVRDEWLSAARTVNTGSGDRADATELVASRVVPFVANEIGAELMDVMGSTERSVRQAYDGALAAMAGESMAAFETPGQLGPIVITGSVEHDRESPPAFTAPSAALAAVPAGVVPAAWSAPVAPPEPTPMAGATSFPSVPADLPAATAAEPQWGSSPDAPQAPQPGSLGGAVPSLGAGFSGLGQTFADLLSGLLGSGGDGLSGGFDTDREQYDGPADEEPQGSLDEDDTSDDDASHDEDPDAADDEEADGTDSGSEDDGTDLDHEEPEDGAGNPGNEPQGDSGEPGEPTSFEQDPTAVEPGAIDPAGAVASSAESPAPVLPEPVSAQGPPAEQGSPDATGSPCDIAAADLPQLGEQPAAPSG